MIKQTIYRHTKDGLVLVAEHEIENPTAEDIKNLEWKLIDSSDRVKAVKLITRPGSTITLSEKLS